MKTTLYIPGDSFLHRLDPRTKMVWMICTMISVFILFNPIVPLVMILILVVALLFAVRTELFKNALVRFLPVIILTVSLTHGFVNPAGKTPILISGIPIALPYFGSMKWEGLYFGILLALRISATFFASIILVLTTTPEDMVSAIAKLGVPYQYASFFGMSLQMIPIMQEEAAIIVQAQRARALRENNLWEKIQALVPLFVPLAVGSMQRAETTAMVLEARAFGAPVKRTELHMIQLTPLDYLVMIVFIAVMLGLIGVRIFHGDITWMYTVRTFWGLFLPVQLAK
ncbi:MAG: energy-coupling factor transporter transmembrane protein EcfT [Methanothrix sp.]|nr:energy-coupling factor transporter transmembrane protein EcfT [Methanothrix sp.]